MQDFGYVHHRRPWRLIIVIGSVMALAAGLVIGFEARRGPGPAPAADAGSPVAVHVVQGRTVHIPPMRPYHRPPASWPAAQTASVKVAATSSRAGSTPVFVGPAQASSPRVTATDAPSQVQVSVASQQAASALGVHGMMFQLAASAGSPGGRMHVSVDYSGFAAAYG